MIKKCWECKKSSKLSRKHRIVNRRTETNRGLIAYFVNINPLAKFLLNIPRKRDCAVPSSGLTSNKIDNIIWESSN